MKLKLIGIGMVVALGLINAPADTFLYDATGALLKAFGADALSYGVDPALNVSSSSTGQPVSAVPGGQALLAVPVVPKTGPASTGISATANLTGLGGGPSVAMNDLGSAGDAVAGDGVYSLLATVGAGTPLGTQLIEVTFTDAEGRTWSDMISLDVQAAPDPSGSSEDTPTLPEWGMILLGLLLVVLAARNLPRRAMGCALAVGLLTITARAQDYPMWQNAVMDMTETPSVMGGGVAQDIRNIPMPEAQGGGIMAQAALSVPASVDAEVAALAAALGDASAVAGENEWAKAVRIFDWVRNNIDYEHYYGLRKGAALTLLEGAGNDFDQCALLGDLLKAAGYPAAGVRFFLFSNLMDYEVLRDWMGLADEPFPGKTYQQAYNSAIPAEYGAATDKVAKQATFGWQFLKNRGSGTVVNGGLPYVYDPALPAKARFVFDRLIVALTLDGGSSYAFLDPSFKTYSTGTGMDLLASSGYSRSTLLTQAAGTADTNSVSGLSQTAINAYLTARATALLGSLGTGSLDSIVSGRNIIKSAITNLGQTIPLPEIPNSAYSPTQILFNSMQDAGFAAYKSTVRFQSTAASGLDFTIPTSDLKGRKITLTFNGTTAELRLDDDTLADTGALGAATTMDLSITVTHPGTIGAYSETKTYRKTTTAGDACSYAIIYGFNASGRLLAKRQEQLKSFKDALMADDSRQVRTELLNIMGLTWLYQTELTNRVLATKNHVIPLLHHRFGRMAQEAGFYVDVGLQYSGYQTDDGVNDTGRNDNVFHLGSLFWSAMEHGVIQQMQVKADGSPYDAVSTVNILRSANSAGGSQKVYLGRLSNWNTIKSSLTGYDVYNGAFDFGEPFVDANSNGVHDPGESFTDQTIKTNLEWLINNKSAQLFLPQSANVTQGIWTGTGWVIRAPQIAGMIINGGYSGGYATSVGKVASPVITTSYSYNPAPVYKPPTVPVIKYTPPPPAAPRYFASDPVDMASGAFTYASEDMATGTEGAPRGLSFSRNYSSNLSTRDDQNMGYGWTHNLHIRAESRTASDEILGMGTPQQAASFLTALVAASDLYRIDATPKEWGTAALTVGWFVDQMRNSAVSVRMGKDIFQFVVQPDGTYTAPAGSTMSLLKVSGAYQLKQRLGNTIIFDAAGKATSIVDVDAKAMTFNYNANGTINYVEDCYARRFTFGYNGTHITGIMDNTSPTRSIAFGYDTTNWNLTSATDPEAKVSSFDYVVAGDEGNTVATDHRIVRLRNNDNETITQNIWDSLGRVKKQLLHGDANKAFNLYYTGRDNFEVNPQGGVTHYYYDERGRAVGSKDPDGNANSMSYDGQDRVVTKTSAAGEVTGYAWDAANNLRRIDHPRGGGSTYMDYDGLNRLDLVTDPNTLQTKYLYFGTGNDAGKDRPQFVKAAFGTADESVTEYTYISSGPAIGRVQTIKDGDNLTTQKTYDTYGQPDVTTLPGNFTINEDYSARGNLDAITDPNLKKTSYTYNKRRQVTNEVADQTGIAAATDTGIDNQARVATVTAPADNGGQRPQESRTYNPTDKLRLQKLNGVTVADTVYDSRDWSYTVKDAANRTTTLLYKANGAVKEAQRPGARTTKFFYDGDNRVTLSSNPGSNSGTRNEGFVYDTTAGGLPRTVKTEADGKTVTSEFDRKGQLRFLKDRKGATFEFRYDGLGRRTHVITPQNQATITSYKKNGRVASVSEPSGDSATFNYNATTGRLSSVVYSGAGGGTVNYTGYDSNGNVTALNENGANGISRAYDGLNRVTSYTFAGQTIGYRYYPSGKLANLIYPGGSETGVGHVEYTYNADGRLYQVIDKLDSTSSPRTTTYAWYSDGRLQSISRPNGTTRTISYETSTGRPSGIAESAGLNWTIGYWSSDDIKTLDLTPAIPANQFSAVSNASMTFDSANQLATFNGQTVTHDLDGNMLTGPKPDGGMALYSYDSRNRLTGMGTTAYTYNAENNRIGITSPTETTTLVVDPEGSLPKVISRTKNGVTTRYVYGAGLQYEVSSAGAATYYHFDQTGNTAALSNQAGSIIERVAYSPYGIIRYRQSNFDTPFLYGGYFGVMVDSNGLINMRARYYNPATMRFINSDPAHAGLNWYAYAGGNPISFTDPTGLWFGPDDALFVAGGAAIGVGGRIIGDLLTNTHSSWEDYTAAAVGGAAGGGVLLYTANPFLAGAASGATSNIVAQVAKNASGKQQGYDVGSLAFDTAFGTATGLLAGRPAISGINAGRGSSVQVFKQIVTKAKQGQIQSITTPTAVKMAQGAAYEYAVPHGAAASAISSTIYGSLTTTLPTSSRK